MSENNLSETVLEFEVNLEAGFFVRLDKVEQARVLAVAKEDDLTGHRPFVAWWTMEAYRPSGLI